MASSVRDRDVKTQRLLNLMLALLSTRRPLRKDELREKVLEYQLIADDSFDRTFERDKAELRELGIPLVTESTGFVFDDELGYRIDRRTYQLPPVSFTRAEAQALQLAALTWESSSLGQAASSAMRKLSAADLDGDLDMAAADEAEDGSAFGIATDVPGFAQFKQAVLTCRVTTFEYRRSDGVTALRRVKPWALQAWHGRWYVTGFDLNRKAERVFRLDRVTGPVKLTGKTGAYQIPSTHEPVARIRAAMAPQSQSEAILLIAKRAGQRLRARGTTPVEQQAVPPGFDAVMVPYHRLEQMARECASYGPDVVVLTPPELRHAVIHLLAGAAGVPVPETAFAEAPKNKLREEGNA